MTTTTKFTAVVHSANAFAEEIRVRSAVAVTGTLPRLKRVRYWDPRIQGYQFAFVVDEDSR